MPRLDNIREGPVNGPRNSNGLNDEGIPPQPPILNGQVLEVTEEN